MARQLKAEKASQPRPPEPEPVNPLALAVRNIGATVAGIIIGEFIGRGIQSLGLSIFPSGLTGTSTEADFAAFMQNASAAQLAFPLASYLLSAFAAAFLAHRLGRVDRPVNSIAAGGFLAMFYIFSNSKLPNPFWFTVLALALVAGGTWIGYKLARRSKLGEIIV
jgi:hypothetical protein